MLILSHTHSSGQPRKSRPRCSRTSSAIERRFPPRGFHVILKAFLHDIPRRRERRSRCVCVYRYVHMLWFHNLYTYQASTNWINARSMNSTDAVLSIRVTLPRSINAFTPSPPFPTDRTKLDECVRKQVVASDWLSKCLGADAVQSIQSEDLLETVTASSLAKRSKPEDKGASHARKQARFQSTRHRFRSRLGTHCLPTPCTC